MRAIVFLILFGLVGAASAQELTEGVPPISYQPEVDSPIGERNPSAPPETAQYDFVIGDWDVVINFRNPDGTEITYAAKWHNIWVADGHVVMQEWRGPWSTGQELRRYMPDQEQWVGFNIYNGWGAPNGVTASMVGDEMVVMIDPVTDERGEFINRETYSNITEDRWEMRSDRSYDGGETWERGAYDLVATRSP